MKRRMQIAIAVCLGALPVLAESINPATVPKTVPMSAAEKKNLQFAENWWREVIQARHLELSPKYQVEDYIQHNPTIPTGRAAFIAMFGQRPAVNPIPAKLDPAPVVAGAKGDFVWMIWEREEKDPRDASKTYHYNTFDVVRIENGKIQEHWDSNQRVPGSKEGGSPITGIAKGSTGKVSADEKKNIALMTEEMKDMLQYGHLELADKTMDPGYIQHNPNVPQGREGFKQFMSRVPGRVPEPVKPEWKAPPVLTLANGPFVFMMWDRKAKDPSDPGKEYTWNHFDVVRVEKGLIKEHWDEARIAAPQPQGKQ
ncbi:MAG: nuclear transport factor 2 family protein [Bryobacteraceae bacterium]